MTDYNELFHTLDSYDTPDETRAKLIDILKPLATYLRENAKDTTNTAYGIAGFMAIDYIRSLSDNDPVIEILAIAGELETSPENSDELRKELINKIEAL